ncbi:MAG TPA: hypothetical protein VNJ08_16790 [Bacteriovoracaceae bacterium]|nr:hypothetical protein [Bacteriovoracaceae bacterium]
MNDEERQRDRWYHVKNKITETWGNISDEELETTRGNISAISHLILDKYGESKQEVASKLVDVMHSVDSDDDLDIEQDRKINDTSESDSKEWEAREDYNSRLQ